MSSKRKRADDLPENPLEGLPLTGTLSQLVTDSTVANQQPAKEGGPIKRKKVMSLAVLIEQGVIKDGAVLRYMKGTGLSYSGKLMAVGRARMEGVEVHGNSALLGMSGFEAYAKSTAHRPAQFTFVSNGLSLQQLQQQQAGKGGGSARRPPGKWGMTWDGRATHYPNPPALTDLNDESCRICWQGGEMLCCETCPAVMHAQCAGLPQVPGGDWHCPSCTCSACGHAAVDPAAEAPLLQAILVEPKSGGDAPVWKGPLSRDKSEAAVTMDAYAFDSVWPREGALAARMQLQAQAQAEKAAKAAAWQAQEAAQQPPEAAQQHARTPSARLAQRPPTEPKEDSPAPLKEESASVEQMDIENETVQPPTDLRPASLAEEPEMPQAVSSPRIGRSMAHLSVPPVPEAPADQSLKEAATAAANADVAFSAKACAAASQLEPSLAPSPRRSLRSPQAFQACDAPAAEAPASKTQTGKLHQAAHKAHSRQEIISILDDMFPPTRSAAKGNALKEAFAAVCPGLPWKARSHAITQMAQRLWDMRGGAKAGAAAPQAPSERQRKRGAGALMSAALAAELSNDAELDTPPPGRFLQVDGCDDTSSADEAGEAPQQPPAWLAANMAPSQTLAGYVKPVSGPSRAPGNLTASAMRSQAAVVGGQAYPGIPGMVPAAQFQGSVPPYLLATQQSNPGQHMVPHAEALTAALHQEVGELSRRLGPAAAVHHVVHRQMLAMQQNNAAMHQRQARTVPPMGPPMPAQATAASAYSVPWGIPPPQQAPHASVWQPAMGPPQPPAQPRVIRAQTYPTGPPAHAQQPQQPPARPSAAQARMRVAAQHTAAGAVRGPAVPAAAEPGKVHGAAAQRPLPTVPQQSAAPLGPLAQPLTQAPGPAPDAGPAMRPLSAGFDSAEEAVKAFGRPTAPVGQPPSGVQAALASCAGCGQRRHLGCLPQDAQEQAKQGTWFHSDACRAVSARMAELAISGLMPVQAGGDAAFAPKLAWQLIRGAAVSSPKDCCGHAPAYGEGARETLTETLYALRHMFHEAMGPLHDARSGQDLLPGLLQGKTFSQQLLDFSGFHTAVLWLGPSVVAAGVVRALGADAAEVPALAVRPELQGNRLGRLLLALLENTLHKAGVKLLAMPALVPYPSCSPKQGAPADGHMTAAMASPTQEIPTWAKLMGYRQATCAQLARMAALPVLHFHGAQFAVKELSVSTCLKVQPPEELQLSEEADEQDFCKDQLLQPAGLSAYAAQQQRAQAQARAPGAAAQEPKRAAGGPQPVSGDTDATGAVAMKSEPNDGAGNVGPGRTAVGSLGRVKVPKGGFSK